jgi:hypothetical protein
MSRRSRNHTKLSKKFEIVWSESLNIAEMPPAFSVSWNQCLAYNKPRMFNSAMNDISYAPHHTHLSQSHDKPSHEIRNIPLHLLTTVQPKKIILLTPNLFHDYTIPLSNPLQLRLTLPGPYMPVHHTAYSSPSTLFASVQTGVQLDLNKVCPRLLIEVKARGHELICACDPRRSVEVGVGGD